MYVGKNYYLEDLELNQKLKVQIIDIQEEYIVYRNLILNIDKKIDKNKIKIIDFSNYNLNTKEVKSIKTPLIKAIIGRNELIEYSKDNFKELNIDENTILISITDLDRKKIDEKILRQFKNSLSISFKDISYSISKAKPLTFKQAFFIRKFIEENNNNNFVVHCEEGISRSSGIALAIYKILKPEEFYEFEKTLKTYKRYTPNYEVFELITKYNKYTLINKIKDLLFKNN